MIRSPFITLTLSLIVSGAFGNPQVWAENAVNEVTCNEVTAEQVSQVVTTQIDSWKSSILFGLEFSSLPEKHEVFPAGKPLQVNTITPASLQNYTPGDFESILVHTGNWYAPVLTTANNPYLLEVSCQNDSLNIVGAGFNGIAQPLNTLSQKVNLESTKNWIVRIDETSRLFLAVTVNTDTTIYPLITFPSQYDKLKPIDSFGGYRDSEVLLLISTEFLKTANAVNITPALNVHIPAARYEGSMAVGGSEIFWVDFKYLPNPDNRLLFEATYGLVE